jgi:hypothetical protein
MRSYKVFNFNDDKPITDRIKIIQSEGYEVLNISCPNVGLYTVIVYKEAIKEWKIIELEDDVSDSNDVKEEIERIQKDGWNILNVTQSCHYWSIIAYRDKK